MSSEQHKEIQPLWKSMRPTCLITALLIIIMVSSAYLFIEIPFIETCVSLPHEGIRNRSLEEQVKKGAGLSAESTAIELQALEEIIQEFKVKSATSEGISKEYNVVEFLKWAMNTYFSLPEKGSDSKESLETFTSMTGVRGEQPKEERKKYDSKNTVQLQPKTKNPEMSKLDKSSRLEDSNTESNSTGHQIDDGILQSKEAENNKTKGANPRRRLVLFTTWVYNPKKQVAHDNILRTWRLWEPLVMPLLFTNHNKVATYARSFGWQTLPAPRSGCKGRKVPVLREMFRSAMRAFDSHLYAFVNGDILLGNGLLSTVEALVNDGELMRNPLLGLVNRINVDFYHTKRKPVYTLKSFDKLADDGYRMTDGSSDGFITNKLFPWQHVPDIVPGKKGIAMWLVSYAREMGVATVDVQETLRAVHMMVTEAGNNESNMHPDSGCNHRIYNELNIKPRSWYCGFLKCAQYKTTWDTAEGSKITIVDKSKNNHVRCAECEMDVDSLKETVY